MKQFSQNSNFSIKNPFSSVLVKFALCFLFLGLAYHLFSSTFVQFSPNIVISDDTSFDVVPSQTFPPPPPPQPVNESLISPSDPLPNAKNNTTSQNGQCNLFEGDWVQDPSRPYYTNNTCFSIEDHQNCMKNGRPDTGFLSWRWNPRDCDLPKFNPTKFLSIMKNKSMAFIGDSIMRNHVQSLLCTLSQVEEGVEVYHDKAYKSKRWYFPSHGFTLSVLWSPFLSKAAIFEDDNGVTTDIIQLHLDELDPVWTNEVKNFDYILVAGGKWFLKNTIYYENNTVVGCHNCQGKNNITEVGFDYAYRKVLNSTLNYIITSNHKVFTFFRTTTPDHFENGEWNTGGYCNRTKPFKEGEVEMISVDEIMHRVEIEEFEKAKSIGFEKGLSFKLFDTTKLSLLRGDGHPGAYRQYHPFDENKNVAKVQNDCLHWCLPGPIDSWNDLMLEMLL
ncbi:hypothetical protein M9H77_33156 [Catharanthus roseus]|uniref:Uncharacterized protein n=1 Tax=Catharanthus roseus TaxID=4058 RepID=A0ACB9ZHU9_CATRO|nr:hypothetical protein M9H77_33156 [Catharanthus roseus]